MKNGGGKEKDKVKKCDRIGFATAKFLTVFWAVHCSKELQLKHSFGVTAVAA